MHVVVMWVALVWVRAVRVRVRPVLRLCRGSGIGFLLDRVVERAGGPLGAPLRAGREGEREDGKQREPEYVPHHFFFVCIFFLSAASSSSTVEGLDFFDDDDDDDVLGAGPPVFFLRSFSASSTDGAGGRT